MGGPISRAREACISPAMAPNCGQGGGRLLDAASITGGRAISAKASAGAAENCYRRRAGRCTRPPSIGIPTTSGPAICGGGSSPSISTVVPTCLWGSPSGRGGG